MNNQAISVLHSWTVWLNTIPAILVMLQQLLDLNIVPAKYAWTIFVLMSALNLILRIFKTSKPIVFSTKNTE